MKTRFRWIVISATLFLLMAGCGSNRETDGTITGSDNSAAPLSAATVGLDVCTNCHTGQTSQWLGGVHGNQQAIDHATHASLDLGLGSDGFPYYDYFSDNTCAGCHDPLGDGERLTAEWTGNVARPVVGCESCHGGGQYHNGIGPLPYAKPGAEQCGQCHNADFDHNRYHPEGDNIVEDYLASPHASSINEHNYADGSEDIRARCSKCHTDEGGKQFKNVEGDYATLSSTLDAEANLTGANVVQCRTCHDAHSPKKKLLKDELLDVDGVTVLESAEYRTCTNCHQSADAYHDPAVNAYGALGEIITDTHFDDGSGLLGYNIDPADDRACRNCHNVHAADTAINNQWAASGHGDLTANFTVAYGAPKNPACQECHSATAATMLFDAYETGGTYAAPGSDISGPAPEVIYCTVCHADNAGGLRAPGAITTHYRAAGSDAYAVIDAVNGSNLCLACHAGKRSGQDIKEGVNAITSRVTSHYLPAGGVMFGQIGYHFDHLEPTLVYTETKHKRIGDASYDWADYPYGTLSAEQVAAIQGSGNGPCVACHMADGSDSHRYSAFTDNTANGVPDLCYNCHSSDPASYYFKSKDKLENEIKPGYLATLAYIELTMMENAQNYRGERLSIAGSGQFQVGAIGFEANLDPTLQVDEDLAGALFNYKLFKDDNAGYVHNRYYAKQLLFDSIDYLEDGVINGSITVGDAAAATWLDGDAATSGVQRK